jgi:hypothetical protein
MRRVLLLLALGAPGWGLADVAAPGRTIPCYCRDSVGGRVEMGEEACLVVNGRAFMARCEMALNVPAWRTTGEGCVSAASERGLDLPHPTLQTRPVHAEVLAPEAQS